MKFKKIFFFSFQNFFSLQASQVIFFDKVVSKISDEIFLISDIISFEENSVGKDNINFDFSVSFSNFLDFKILYLLAQKIQIENFDLEKEVYNRFKKMLDFFKSIENLELNFRKKTPEILDLLRDQIKKQFYFESYKRDIKEKIIVFYDDILEFLESEKVNFLPESYVIYDITFESCKDNFCKFLIEDHREKILNFGFDIFDCSFINSISDYEVVVEKKIFNYEDLELLNKDKLFILNLKELEVSNILETFDSFFFIKVLSKDFNTVSYLIFSIKKDFEKIRFKTFIFLEKLKKKINKDLNLKNFLSLKKRFNLSSTSFFGKNYLIQDLPLDIIIEINDGLIKENSLYIPKVKEERDSFKIIYFQKFFSIRKPSIEFDYSLLEVDYKNFIFEKKFSDKKKIYKQSNKMYNFWIDSNFKNVKNVSAF
jgi:hypothetical protein